MSTCSLNDFMRALEPWLSDNYIRKAYLNKKGDFVLHFMDNVSDVYRLDDCNEMQIREILLNLESRGVAVTQ